MATEKELAVEPRELTDEEKAELRRQSDETNTRARIEEVKALTDKRVEVIARINAKLTEILEKDLVEFHEHEDTLRRYLGTNAGASGLPSPGNMAEEAIRADLMEFLYHGV